jgi:putative protein kinase ArgK-like GTPase of G3E family
VGRTAELAVFDRLFAEDPPTRVVHVHGPGGIGKSALLRQVERLGAQRGPRLGLLGSDPAGGRGHARNPGG